MISTSPANPPASRDSAHRRRARHQCAASPAPTSSATGSALGRNVAASPQLAPTAKPSARRTATARTRCPAARSDRCSTTTTATLAQIARPIANWKNCSDRKNPAECMKPGCSEASASAMAASFRPPIKYAVCATSSGSRHESKSWKCGGRASGRILAPAERPGSQTCRAARSCLKRPGWRVRRSASARDRSAGGHR